MNKGFKGFLIGLLVLVAGFFITSLSMASVDGHSIVDEWKSWFPQEQIEETIETEEDTTEDEVVVEEETTEEEQASAQGGEDASKVETE